MEKCEKNDAFPKTRVLLTLVRGATVYSRIAQSQSRQVDLTDEAMEVNTEAQYAVAGSDFTSRSKNSRARRDKRYGRWKERVRGGEREKLRKGLRKVLRNLKKRSEMSDANRLLDAV